MQNPFNYGKLAENENFIDRKDDVLLLKNMLGSGINTILVSPRRWGKSSLVKRCMNELQAENADLRVCFIDAFTIHTSQEFYQTFAKEVIKATASTWDQWVINARKYLHSIVPKISLGTASDSDFSLSFNFNEIKDSKEEILNLPQKIASEKKIRIIVCIDEFQNLADLSDYEQLESMMRSVWQHQQSVTYCLYGSQRHMMTEIFNSSQKPFYRFGQMLYLKKIDETEWVNYIIHCFKNTGKTITDDMAARIAATVKNHSWYVQQYAAAVWNYTPEHETVTEQILDKALNWVIETNVPNFQTEYMSLSASRIHLLLAVASNERQLTSAETMKKYSLGTSANVVKNKDILIRKDILDISTDRHEFIDPVFEIWFKRLNGLS